MTAENKEEKKVLTIDPKNIREGTCQIFEVNEQKFSVCKEKGKIKIFPTLEVEE